MVDDICGHRQGRSLVHVDDDVELGLVVQRQHLDRHALGVEQGYRQEENDKQGNQEQAAASLARDQRHQGLAEQATEPFVLPVLGLLHLLQFFHRRLDAHGQPGREDEGGKNREQHGKGTKCRDRLHVGTHHAAHETHRQQRGDYREGRKNGRVADLAHGVDGDIGIGAFVEQPATVDILDHDDGIVHEYADGKDQRKQAHSVDGVAADQGIEHGDQDHHRNHDHDHYRRLPAEVQRGPDQHHHDGGGHKQFEDELVDLVLGGLAVVAGHRNMNVVRDHAALEGLDLVKDIPGDGHAVGTLFLRQRDGHRRGGIGFLAGFLRGFLGGVVADQMTGIGRLGHHRGDIAHIHR